MKVTERSAVLNDIFTSGFTRDPAGNLIKVHSEIKLAFAQALYENVFALAPKVVIEVGMAYGVSSLAILTALRDLGGERKLISIDPYQARDWGNCGLEAVKRGDLQHLHELIEEPSYLALPELVKKGTTIEFGYIDGWHTFDYTLMDFWYLDRMLAVNGIVGFNDCDWPAVHKTLNFVTSHRNYEEIDVGLRRNYIKQFVKACLNTPKGQPPSISYRDSNDRYFCKKTVWEPNFDFFSNF